MMLLRYGVYIDRSALVLSRRRLSNGRVTRHASISQISSSVCHRREFSSVPSQNASPRPGSSSKSTDTGKTLSKALLGSAAFGACFYAAYSRGYLNDILGQKQQNYDSLKVDNSSIEKLPRDDGGLHDSQNLKEPTSEGSGTLNSHVNDALERAGPESTKDIVGDSGKFEGESDSFFKTPSNSKEEVAHFKEEDLPKVSDKTAKDEYPISQESSGEKAQIDQHEVDEKGNDVAKDDPEELKLQNEPKEPSASLLDTYHLEDKVHDGASTISGGEEETSPGAFGDAYVSEDRKLIFDFLQAIHAAEQRQAELDARVFSEEKKAIAENYEKELKDARARELMYAEEAAMLEKEVKKEKAKAAAALKSLQERAEERLKMELEEKEREADSKLKEVQDLAKAELAASIAREKAAQIEKMAEANLNISALCMAFYARSEEARQTHSIQKLALGALAFENAMSNGLPVQAELDALHIYVEDVDKDSLLQLAISSVPEDVRLHGTDTHLQLNQKFDALKGKLRHFSLIPPHGGGILSHSLAHVASFLKVKEGDQSGDGIESVLNKVDRLLAQGKLVEAADVLENGVKGSKAAEVVGDWLRRARNRAISEQALVLLQSYAASVSLT